VSYDAEESLVMLTAAAVRQFRAFIIQTTSELLVREANRSGILFGPDTQGLLQLTFEARVLRGAITLLATLNAMATDGADLNDASVLVVAFPLADIHLQMSYVHVFTFAHLAYKEIAFSGTNPRCIGIRMRSLLDKWGTMLFPSPDDPKPFITTGPIKVFYLVLGAVRVLGIFALLLIIVQLDAVYCLRTERGDEL
jgi:hypothetical protein